MKTINISQNVTVPDGVKCSVKARTVTVTGPRGKLVKSFRHLKVDISKVDKKTLKVEKWFGLHKELAAVRTICSHITNMFTRRPSRLRSGSASTRSWLPSEPSAHTSPTCSQENVVGQFGGAVGGFLNMFSDDD